MLPPFIIEQIRKREEEETRPAHRPVVELPVPAPRPRRESDVPGEERGVIVIDLAGD
jgi:hypothetical protein